MRLLVLLLSLVTWAEDVETIRTYNDQAGTLYVCKALATQPGYYYWTVASGALTSITVTSNVGTATFASAHGLTVGSSFVVTGATSNAFLGVIFTVASVPTSATLTFSITLANGTYSQTITTLQSRSPRTNGALWAIQKIEYSSSTTIVKWANGNGNRTNICDNMTTLVYQ